MKYTDEIGEDEKLFITEALNFLKDYQCNGKYERILLDNKYQYKVKYIIKNPGWSVYRTNAIRLELYAHIKSFCEEHGLTGLLGEIYLSFG